MNQEIICINDKYPQHYIDFFAKWNITVPIENKVYSLRDKVLHTTGEWGIRVNEIINPKIPVVSSLLPDAYMETSFHIKRFADLLGNPLLKEKEPEILELENELKKTYEQSRNKSKRIN